MPVTTPNTMMCHNFPETFMVSKNEAWNTVIVSTKTDAREQKFIGKKVQNGKKVEVFCERQSKPATMKKNLDKNHGFTG